MRRRYCMVKRGIVFVLAAMLLLGCVDTGVYAADEGAVAAEEEKTLANNEYEVVFDGNGADNSDTVSMQPLIIKRGKTKALPKNLFKKNGYYFGGWKNVNNNKTYKDKAKVKNIAKGGESIVLQAIWKPNTYNITFASVSKVTGKMSKQTYKYGADTKLRANKFKCKGYDFIGWSLAKQYNDENPLIENEALISGIIATQKNNATVKLYAQWQPVVYHIVYDPCGGEPVNSTEFTILDGMSELPTPVRAGYIFKGWYKSAEYTKKMASVKTGTTGDLTLYAKWEAAPSEDRGPGSQTGDYNYVINTNTKKFHRPYCNSVKQIADEHRLNYSGSREEVVGMGYAPCKKCNP